MSVLDGWRGIAILFVLAGHLLPLGPKMWHMNYAFAATGMVIFFNLSGFLITNILLHNQNIATFLTKRLIRIVPLAWLTLVVTFTCAPVEKQALLPHFLFYANWGNPMALTGQTSHFWSLCLEMQFYAAIAGLVLIFKKNAFYLLPFFCLLITINRWHNNVGLAINTDYRLDEILAGCILALVFNSSNNLIKKIISSLNPILLFLLVLISAHPMGGFFMYLRPYFSMAMVGATLFSDRPAILNRWLSGKFLFYIATISYALYVIHGGLRYTWLGEGDKVIRYLKRPLYFMVTFALAHLSTFYFEKKWIAFGKRITMRHTKIIS
nr:acyltransferase [uncultured Desulfobulbus sp.]